MKKLSDLSVVVSTHVYATGPAHDLRDYLLSQKAKSLLFIGHPLFYEPTLKGSGYESYKNGILINQKYKPIHKIPSILLYCESVFLNIFFVIKFFGKWDLYIGNDNLNTLSGIFLKKIGLVKKVIFYVIDYNPKRFQNPLMNSIYHWIDQYCVKNADETWNLSPRMEVAREEYFHFKGGNQKVVPVGIWFDRFPRVDIDKVKKQTLVFMGHVLKKQGIQYVLEAISSIVEKIPNFKFLVIGGGEYLDSLKKIVEEKKLTKYVKFTGFVKDHKEIEQLLPSCAIAVALYEKYDNFGNLSYTYFADPAKIKSYLASGLPVLITDVSYNAKELEKEKCGKVVNLDAKEISEAVIYFMKNEGSLNSYRKNAVKYAQKYDWNNIFKNAFESI